MILNLLDCEGTLYEIEINIKEIDENNIPYALIMQIEKDFKTEIVDYWVPADQE